MPPATPANCLDRSRHLWFLSTPTLWEYWPFLALVRRNPGKEEECGLLCDLFKLTGTPGGSSTVYFCNLFLIPSNLDDFLALPREVFDTPEEVYAAGWRVD